jgi:RNA polymerase sigma-70 factor (ECF subfamily)
MQVLLSAVDDIAAAVPPMADARVSTAELIATTYDAHQRELYSFALASTRDPEAAADLLQEAFTRLIIEIDADRTPTNVRAWLYRVISNLAVSRGRRASVAQRHAEALVKDDRIDGPEPAFLEHERNADLAVALGELDIAERAALVMAANGFKGLEIADAIGRSGAATRTMMCRSRVHLRQRLASMGPLA